MPVISYDEQSYECQDGETVLQCLTRHGVSIPSSCQSGVCQTCLMQAIRGRPPATAQQGLKDTLQAQHYFMACVCTPEEDMEVVLAGADITHLLETEVVCKESLNHDILRICLQPSEPFDYKPGQFINLYRPDGLVRSYSLASLPQRDEPLELQVRILPGGSMSAWIQDEMKLGDHPAIEGPMGSCFYLPGKPEQNILLVGTGTGLAPLWGIARDALDHGHHGQIQLYHGSYNAAGLYLMAELRALEQAHDNFIYTPCVDEADEADPEDITVGRADLVALDKHPDLKSWRIYLCGHPAMVTVMKKKAFLAGASLGDIYADPFAFSIPDEAARNGSKAAVADAAENEAAPTEAQDL